MLIFFYIFKLSFQLLNDSKISYEVVELDKRDDGKNIQEALLEITGAKTVNMLLISMN